MRSDLSPIIDANDTKDFTINSCFKILTNQIAPGDPFAMTIDLKKVYFINSVLFVQDVLDGYLGSVSTADLDKYHATQIDVHIGNDSNWQNNQKCTLTPRFAADHKDSIKDWSYGGYEGAEVPNYGFVEWCNMSGQYVTFVVHGVPSESLSVYNVSINGNSFIRDISP